MGRGWCCCLIIFFFFSINGLIVNAQEQRIADSLIAIYESSQYEDELELLLQISKEETNPENIIYYSEKLIEKASEDSIGNYLVSGFMQLGNGQKLKGDFYDALDSYFQAIKLAQRFDQQQEVGALYISVADIYSTMEDYETADNYYDEGILMLRKLNNFPRLAIALLNSGEKHFFANNYPKALSHLEEAKDIFTQIGHPIGLAYSLGNLGMVYLKQNKNELAEDLLKQAIEILEKNQDLYPVSVYERYLADIYFEKGNTNEALKHARRSLTLAESYSLKTEMADASLKLFELHKELGNGDSALFYHLNYIDIRDSIRNLAEVENIARLTRKFEVSQKQDEVDLLNQKNRTQKVIVFSSIIALLLIGILAMGLYRRNSFIRKTNNIIEEERNRADRLLRNILPAETVKELKEFGKVKAKRFESVSVLFTDFKGFTSHASHLPPEDLVQSLDFYFSHFDKIIDKYKLEKIKTLGDSYMCAAGLPFPQEDHAERIILAAMEIVDFVENSKHTNKENLTRFEMRLGISSGPVVAGVVGHKKFAYDIWGDTVNCASRMEQHSEVGKINISEDTHKLIADKFYFSDRGEIFVKNKGNMKMYFVEGINKNSVEELESLDKSNNIV